MGRVVQNFDIQDGREAAKALGTNTELIYFFIDLEAQLFDAILRATGNQLLNINRAHQGLFGQ